MLLEMSWIKKNINLDVADYLFNICVSSLPERIGSYQRDVRPDVATDYEMLEEQLAETPEMLVFWDMLLAEQVAKVAALERKNKAIRGEVTQRLIDVARDNKYDIRRSDIQDIVEADQDVILVEAEIILQSKIENKLRAVVNALRLKADSLRSLAGFKREEKRQP